MPAPPQFKDLGKKTKDLFKKQYDYKNEIKVISKASGVKLESTGLHGKGGLVGSTKANWKDQYLGDIEVEAHSCGIAKGQFKLSKVADGVDVTVSGDFAKADVAAEAVYKQDAVVASLKASHNVTKSSTKLVAAASIGFDGVSVGGQVDLDAAGTPTDYNVGAEYAAKDITASLVTSSKGDDITISFFQKLKGGTLFGGSMLFKPDSNTQVYTCGTEYKLDDATQIKGKANSCGVVGVAVTHVLKDPSMKVGVSSEFDAKGAAFKAQKMGISLSFGEF